MSSFKVIIVGGGVAGLALANCLERAKIDYSLLETRDEIAPQVGASIGIMPNGYRILDQLGCFEKLQARFATVTHEFDRDFDGRLFHPETQSLPLCLTRCGYPVAFGDRQLLLEVLHNNIVDKSKILLKKRLASVEDTDDGVKAVCTDGSVYEGDVIAGADGVYSKVRQEMWRLADVDKPGLISSDEKQCLSVNFKCLYAISYLDPKILDMEGAINMSYAKDRSVMMIGGTEGRLYVFLIEKLDKTYRVPDIPRFTDKEAGEFGASFANVKIVPNIPFSTVWENRLSYKLVTLEEADFETWTHGRLVCLGDSCHKMTPNCAQGGNSSIESAAALTNALKKSIESTPGRPTKEQTASALKGYREARRKRMSAIIKICNDLTGVQALRTWKDRIFITKIEYLLGDAFMDMHSDLMIGASSLDFLPPPKRSLQGAMPFNPMQGEGHKESRIKRAVFATPFLAIHLLIERLQSGKTEWATGSVPILTSFYGLKWLDELWVGIVPAFAPATYGYDLESRWQTVSFLTDLAVVVAVIYIESTRRGNALKPSQLPIILGLCAQFYGIGASIPLYLFAFWTLTPISVFRSTDLRLTNVAYTSSILPALVLGYYIPHLLQFFHPSLEARQQWNWIWQMFPVWVSWFAWVGKKFRTDTMNHDRLWAPKRDLSVIRLTVGAAVAVSALTWWSVLVYSPYSLSQLFVPTGAPGHESLEAWIRSFLKWDELFMVTSLFLWLGFSFWDVKHAGMIKTGWLSLFVALALATLTVGPGAAFGSGWLWREEIITHRRHWAAVTETWAEEKDERRDSGIGNGKEANGVVEEKKYL